VSDSQKLPKWEHEGVNTDVYNYLAIKTKLGRRQVKSACLAIAYNLVPAPDDQVTAAIVKTVRKELEALGWVPNMSIQERWESGWTARLHAFPTIAVQTTGQHTWGILLLLQEIFPSKASAELMRHIIYHDSPEYALGDMPRTAKSYSPELYALYNEVSDTIQWRQMGPSDLTDVEKAIFSYLDAFEFLVFCNREARMGNTIMGTKYHQVCDALPVYAGLLLQGNMITQKEKERMLYVAQAFSLYDRHPLEAVHVGQ